LKLWYQKYPVIQKTIETMKSYAVKIIDAIKSLVSTLIFSKLIPFVQKYKIIVSMRLRRVSPKLAAFLDAIPNKLRELWRTIKVWFGRMHNQFRNAYARNSSNSNSNTKPSSMASTRNGGTKSFAFSSATASAMSRHPPASMSSEVVRKLREQRGESLENLNDNTNSRHRD